MLHYKIIDHNIQLSKFKKKVICLIPRVESHYLTKSTVISLHNFKIMSYLGHMKFYYFYLNILRKLYNATTVLQNSLSSGN